MRKICYSEGTTEKSVKPNTPQARERGRAHTRKEVSLWRET